MYAIQSTLLLCNSAAMLIFKFTVLMQLEQQEMYLSSLIFSRHTSFQTTNAPSWGGVLRERVSVATRLGLLLNKARIPVAAI